MIQIVFLPLPKYYQCPFLLIHSLFCFTLPPFYSAVLLHMLFLFPKVIPIIKLVLLLSPSCLFFPNSLRTSLSHPSFFYTRLTHCHCFLLFIFYLQNFHLYHLVDSTSKIYSSSNILVSTFDTVVEYMMLFFT